MKGRRLRLLAFGALALVGVALAISPALAQQAPGGIAYSIELQATIDPATERWISSALDDAASEDAEIAIIRLDTPGGLSDSMRSIIQDMAAAPLPVVVYVSPNGARAASAGAYITAGRRRRRDGPGDQHRLGDPDRGRARWREQRPRPEDQERRGRLDAGARLRTTGETRGWPISSSPRRRT